MLAAAAWLGVARADDLPTTAPPIIIQPPPDTPVIINPPCPPPKEAPAAAPPPAPVVRHERNQWFDPRDHQVTVGAGVADYVGGAMRSATETGALWDARYTISHRSLVAFEAGYAGTYNKMQSPVEGSGSVAPYIINNSLDGDLRLNLLPFRVQPYVFGGLGYNHASVKNLQDSPAMAQRFNSSDDNLLVPAGGGLAFHLFRHGTIDTRVTYRALFNEKLDRSGDSRTDQWAVSGRWGYAF
jgi:hypothetical protein